MGQLVKKHEVQLTDNDCWRAQLPKIEMEYCSDGRLRVHKGTKGNNPSPDESDSLMLAFLELGKKRVKFHYEGGGEDWGKTFGMMEKTYNEVFDRY